MKLLQTGIVVVLILLLRYYLGREPLCPLCRAVAVAGAGALDTDNNGTAQLAHLALAHWIQTATARHSWHTWRWRSGYRQQRHGTVGTLGAGALGTDSNGTAQLAQLARQEAGDARPILLTEKEVEQEGETCPQAYKNRQNNKNEKQH